MLLMLRSRPEQEGVLEQLLAEQQDPAPRDFATIYNVTSLWNQGFDGKGQSIAIVAQSNIKLSDVMNFRAQFGLPVNDPQIIIVPGSDPGITDDEGEADLDVEWAGAIAKS